MYFTSQMISLWVAKHDILKIWSWTLSTWCSLPNKDGTPLQPLHAHRRRPSGSNLKLASSLKPLSKPGTTDSPSSATPKHPAEGLARKQSRVTFNPAVSYSMLPTPSTCSASGSAHKPKRHARVKVSQFRRQHQTLRDAKFWDLFSRMFTRRLFLSVMKVLGPFLNNFQKSG